MIPLIIILLVLWALGFFAHLGGDLIHILLVVILILVAYNLYTNRRV